MKEILTIRLIILFVFAIFTLQAQDDCTVKLKQAEEFFDDGKIETISSLLVECLKSGFSKDEKIRAYKVIINSYLFEDKLNLAEENMLKLLKLEPELKINKTVDPAEFVNLYKTYKTLPTYSIGIVAGVNLSSVTVNEAFGVHNVSNQTFNYKSSGMGYQFGLNVNRNITSNLQVGFSVNIIQNNFEYTDSIFSFVHVSFVEKQTRIDLPLSVYYSFGKKIFRPYITVGANTGFVISASSTATRSYTDNSHKDITGSDIDLKEYRRNVNFSALAGVGAKYMIKRGYFFFEAKYLYGLLNQVNTNTRYTNPELIYKYYYLDNNFKLNNLMISVGYMYSIYKPKKKK